MEEFKASDNTESGQGGVRASHLVLALLNLSRGDTYADSFRRKTLDNALRLLFDPGETIAKIAETLLGVLLRTHVRFMHMRSLASRTPLRLC